ncbi:MAG: helix-turn-helix domain-containing protein [Candidatus Limnocylindrales bacterium]
MDRSIVTGLELGALIRMRRQANGFDLDDLSRAVGGTPGAAFLGRLEEGSLGPTSSLVLRLAAVLDLPPDLLLNAAGYATETQRLDAIATLANGINHLTSPDTGSKSTAS